MSSRRLDRVCRRSHRHSLPSCGRRSCGRNRSSRSHCGRHGLRRRSPTSFPGRSAGHCRHCGETRTAPRGCGSPRSSGRCPGHGGSRGPRSPSDRPRAGCPAIPPARPPRQTVAAARSRARVGPPRPPADEAAAPACPSLRAGSCGRRQTRRRAAGSCRPLSPDRPQPARSPRVPAPCRPLSRYRWATHGSWQRTKRPRASTPPPVSPRPLSSIATRKLTRRNHRHVLGKGLS